VTDVNLRALVVEAREQGATTDAEVMDYVLGRLGEQQVEVLFSDLLTARIRSVLALIESPPWSKAGRKREERKNSLPLDTPRQPQSWKVAAIREDFALRLDAVLPTPDGDKQIVDFTRKDLMWWSEKLRLQARDTMEMARRFHVLASAMAEHRVETVADLPSSVAMKALEAA
jgi:hypothetical protein